MAEAPPLRFPAQELTRFAAAVFGAVGVPAADAQLAAAALTDAQLCGRGSHGLQGLRLYVGWLRDGTINPRPALTRPLDAGPTATIDGDHGLGQVVAVAAIDSAIAKAQEYGVGAVAARRCGHTGALAAYAERAAASGCIGLVISQSSKTVMAPTGGIDCLVGNNPLAYAFPTRRGAPLVLDIGLSTVSMGQVFLHQQNGWPLPEGWGLDAAGQPTTDPRAVFGGGGTLVPVGEHKGYGLAVAHDILAGVLAGGRFGGDLGTPGTGLFAQAVHIAHFLPLAEYHDHVEQLIEQLRGSAPAPGSAGVVVPGERAHARRLAGLAAGVALDAGTLAALGQLAGELGVSPPMPDATPAA